MACNLDSLGSEAVDGFGDIEILLIEVIEKSHMPKDNVILFRTYPLEVGQKIRIEGGPRRGDWEVIGVDDRKVRLRCPVTFKEVEWDRFCYMVELLESTEWPEKH